MNIFDRFLKKSPSQIEMILPEEKGIRKKTYDIQAALAKALLVFMLSAGAVNGFLMAYDLEYNRLLCMTGLFLFALLMGFLYETGYKPLTNTVMILIFVVYTYMAVTRFWVLNSGAYAVINKMYEVARTYLGVTNGSEYNLRVQDTYQTVTAIALFVGVVGIILITIRTQYSASFLTVFLMTFTLYLIPLYFEKTPDLLDVFLMLAGYITLFLVQCSRNKEHLSKQVRAAMPAGLAVAAVVTALAGVFLPGNRYRLMVPQSQVKEQTKETATIYAQYGMLAILQNTASSGGVSGGQLSRNGIVMPNYKTDLRIRFTPYSMETVYLKAFTGLDYDGNSWSDLKNIFPEDVPMSGDRVGRPEWYESRPEIQGRGIMEVENVDASERFMYKPYYTDDKESLQIGDMAVYTYYPPVSDVEIRPRNNPDARYLDVPLLCYQAVAQACEEAGFSGSPEEIAAQVVDWFDENYTYTLRPGYYYGSMDYISYFLARNKKGYCSHFASSAVMLLRYMGIPARYVEGYAFSYTDMAVDGRLQEEEKYENYYSGYSPLGETALIELEVSDAQAHAWVEIFLEGRGWVVVDPTPAASEEEEETGGFWDVFGGVAGPGINAGGQGGEGLATYFENALTGSAGLIVIFMVAVALTLSGRRVLEKIREGKLPEKERVRLEYHRLTEQIGQKQQDFAALTTPAQEMEWIREHYEVDVPEEMTQEIYRLFFAPETEGNYEELRLQLAGLRRQLKRAGKKVK